MRLPWSKRRLRWGWPPWSRRPDDLADEVIVSLFEFVRVLARKGMDADAIMAEIQRIAPAVADWTGGAVRPVIERVCLNPEISDAQFRWANASSKTEIVPPATSQGDAT